MKNEMTNQITTAQGEAERLISQAIDKNIDVSAMEKLLDMRRELKAEWAREQYNKAMAGFQKECPTIQKTKRVSFSGGGYSYAPLEDIVRQVKDLLSKNGFSYTFDTRKTDTLLTTICRVNHISGHSEESSFSIAIDSSSKMNISQKDGAASTYGKRYAFCNAFGILTGDEDTDARVDEEKTPRQMRQELDKKEQKQFNGEGKATDKQLSYIRDLLTQKRYNEKSLCVHYEIASLDQMTFDQASESITMLLNLPVSAKKKTNTAELSYNQTQL